MVASPAELCGAVYRYASDYGNSYGKPLAWLLGSPAGGGALVSSSRSWIEAARGRNRKRDLQPRYGTGRTVVTNNLLDRGKADRQERNHGNRYGHISKNSEYAPVYPLGRVLAIVETLLTSSLFALFLLAIRRQFRR